MKTQSGFAPIVIILALLVLGGGSYLVFNNTKEEPRKEEASSAREEKKETEGLSGIVVQEENITRLSGSYNIKKGNTDLNFMVFSESRDHAIYFYFSNEEEARKKLNIDTTKIDSSLFTTDWCTIGGQAVIEVSGYDSNEVEKNWKDNVTLLSVISVETPKVSCALPGN